MSLEPEPAFEKLLNEANIPNFDFPETDIRVLAAMIKYYQWIKQPEVKPTKFEVNKKQAQEVLDTIRKDKRVHLSETESYKLLEAYGMKVIQHIAAKDLDGTIAAAIKMGYPVVLKIISPDILHKIDVGGVIMGKKTV
ncbi:MAG: acetate--CoA ligase family protein [Bacteroidia bacterium]